MSERLSICSGGRSPVRGREAPCTPDVNVPLSGEVHKGEVGTNMKAMVRWSNGLAGTAMFQPFPKP